MSAMEKGSLSRSERRKQQTRALLLAACGRLLVERGYVTLTVQAITDMADVGYGTFYLHFTDKDDIVWTVLEGYSEAFNRQVDLELERIEHPRREFLAWLAVFDYVGQVGDSFVTMFGSNGSAALIERYQTFLARLHETNVRAAKYRATVDLPPDFVAQFMTGALMRLLVWWQETPNSLTSADMAGMLFQAIYHSPPPPLRKHDPRPGLYPFGAQDDAP